MTLPHFDTVIIGAGAAGLFCAGRAAQRGLRVLLIDHADKLAEKIRISGGGRCNFTNLQAGPDHFQSENPAFCKSALARFTAADFVALVRRHGIAFHEKHKGQLFCDGPSEQIIAMLLAECALGGVERWQPCEVQAVRASVGGEARFAIDTARGGVSARSLVVATGGLSIPKAGATDAGHRFARQFGHRLITPRPGLVPLTFESAQWSAFADLAGVSLEVEIATAAGRRPVRFRDDLLFTHRGLSGPAVLQVSSFWRPDQDLQIDLAPGYDLTDALRTAKRRSRRQLGNVLGQWLPHRLAQAWLAHLGLPEDRWVAEMRDHDLDRIATSLKHWSIRPSGSEGYRKAEVTVGGVDTREVDSRSMESRLCPGLHFIGEVLDVTGWLGGYNFQWAWSSAAACADALPAG